MTNFKTVAEQAFIRLYEDSRSKRTNEGTKNELILLLVDDKGKSLDIKEINSKVLDSLILKFKSKGNTNATINRKLSILSRIITYAFDRNYVDKKPKIDFMKVNNKKVRWISQDEEIQILSYFKNLESQLYYLTIVLLDTGMRLSEALALKDDNINFEDKVIHVWESKNDQPRTIPMTDRVHKVLSELYSEDYFISLDVNELQYEWRKMKKATGLKDINIHILRHTFCSRLIQRGADITVIQKLAGHESPQTTLRYAHLHNKQLVKAIELLKP